MEIAVTAPQNKAVSRIMLMIDNHISADFHVEVALTVFQVVNSQSVNPTSSVDR